MKDLLKHPLVVILLAVAGIIIILKLASAEPIDPYKGLTLITSSETPVSEPEKEGPNQKSILEQVAKADLETRIDRNGTVYHEIIVRGGIMDASLYTATQKLWDLVNSNATDPLVIRINSPGGLVTELMEFVQAATAYRGTIITINEGGAYSAGAMLYALGDVRVCGVYANVLYHSVQIQVFMETLNVENLTNILSQMHAYNGQLYDMLTRETGQTREQLSKEVFIENKEGNFLSYAKLVKNGLVDLTLKQFNELYFEEGINAVVERNNHQDDH